MEGLARTAAGLDRTAWQTAALAPSPAGLTCLPPGPGTHEHLSIAVTLHRSISNGERKAGETLLNSAEPNNAASAEGIISSTSRWCTLYLFHRPRRYCTPPNAFRSVLILASLREPHELDSATTTIQTMPNILFYVTVLSLRQGSSTDCVFFELHR